MSDLTHHEEDERQLSFTQAHQLLESVVAIGDQHVDLIERREAILTVLLNEIEADCGLWAWGYGKPTDNSIIGVGVIFLRMTEEQRTGIAKLSYDTDVFQEFYCSVFADLDGRPQTRSLLEEDFIDSDGTKLPRVRKYYSDCGWGTWLQNVRYFPRNAFSTVDFYRNIGRPAFNRRDADIVDLVCSSVSWLHATIGETIPAENLRKLTERQRTVLAMLLDGLPRKVIASRLGISENTVGEHLSAIFACFQVSSAMELASQFLRNQ